MSREFARKFYNSEAWKRCRESYKHKVSYLCENCLRKGIYKPGVIVHHLIELDPINIEHPEITLNFDNLELLCRECHAAIHEQSGGQWSEVNKKKRAARAEKNRYDVDSNGHVTKK